MIINLPLEISQAPPPKLWGKAKTTAITQSVINSFSGQRQIKPAQLFTRLIKINNIQKLAFFRANRALKNNLHLNHSIKFI